MTDPTDDVLPLTRSSAGPQAIPLQPEGPAGGATRIEERPNSLRHPLLEPKQHVHLLDDPQLLERAQAGLAAVHWLLAPRPVHWPPVRSRDLPRLRIDAAPRRHDGTAAGRFAGRVDDATT